MIWFKDFIDEVSYTSLIIKNIKTYFFIPNSLTKWRVDNFYESEPETLEWIDSFKKNQNLIFWDIGANIGLYSIYNTLKNKNSITISFEASTSNLRILSRNIFINKLHDKIKIFPLALTKLDNTFLEMNESQFVEGGALNTYGEKFDYKGKFFKENMKYTLYGTNIKFLIENKILEIPDYIKLDVDGTEHLILEGAGNYLADKKVKSILVEINENFLKQHSSIINFMKKNNFKLLHKKQNEKILSKNSNFKKTFNYIFVK